MNATTRSPGRTPNSRSPVARMRTCPANDSQARPVSGAVSLMNKSASPAPSLISQNVLRVIELALPETTQPQASCACRAHACASRMTQHRSNPKSPAKIPPTRSQTNATAHRNSRNAILAREPATSRTASDLHPQSAQRSASTEVRLRERRRIPATGSATLFVFSLFPVCWNVTQY